MGCVQSTSSKAVNPVLDSKEQTHLIIPPHYQSAIEQLKGSNLIVKEIDRKMQQVAYSTDQLASISQTILQTFLQLEDAESNIEVQFLSKLYSDKFGELHKNNQLFYNSVKQIFIAEFKNNRIKPQINSRIFHLISNFKKEKDIDEKYENMFKFPCWKTNGYKILNPAELTEVVRLQAVGEKMEKLGDKLKFKFQTICQESQSIFKLLSECFLRFKTDLQNLKYDLNLTEIKKIAEISREACNYHDNGVYLMLVYLVESCRKLQKEKQQSVKQIELKMDAAIKLTSEMYPPGKGLSQEQKQLETALKNLNFQDKFIFTVEKFTTSNKQAELEAIITKHSLIAQRMKNNFEELIKKTCLARCIQTKIGLKLNPNNPHPKAVTRIKEKLLFKKNSQNKKQTKKTIAQTLLSQERAYKQQIDQLLENQNEITFKMSDMVRGKCTFIEVTDIIATIDDIKQFVRQNSQRFRITEIESRFTNPLPISDVTLKIAINQEVLAQLQLTVQTNAPAYHFAHKIYELDRTKVFSKVKITHNYFEESQQEFKELVQRTLQICQIKQRSSLENQSSSKQINSQPKQPKNQNIQINPVLKKVKQIYSSTKEIAYFFHLQSVKAKDFFQILKEVFYRKTKQTGLPKLSISYDKNLQDFMVILLNKQMGDWDKKIGRQIEKVIISSNSNKLKATLLYYFFQRFDISKEASRMKQFYPTFVEMTQSQTSSGKTQKRLQYVSLYLKQYFGIQNFYTYIFETAKVYIKGQSILKTKMIRQSQQDSVDLVVECAVNGDIVEGESLENLNELKQLLISFKNIRNFSGNCSSSFDKIYRWIMEILKHSPKLDVGTFASQIKLFMAEKLLRQNNNTNDRAEALLKEAIVKFQQHQNHQKRLECELLLLQCKAKSKISLPDFRKDYQRFDLMVKSLGLEMKGELVACAQWRIAVAREPDGRVVTGTLQQFREDQRYVLETHFKKAVVQSSATEGEEFTFKLARLFRSYYNDERINNWTFKPNPSIQYINFDYRYRPDQSWLSLIKPVWDNLTVLNIASNTIGNKGCYIISKRNWKLRQINLENNYFDDYGCQCISKANWPLKSARLSSNRFKEKGCKYISAANWKLTILRINGCMTGPNGCKYLCEANWPLESLSIDNNNIGNQGCKYIAQTKWKLTKLDLGTNQINAEGCLYISQTNWKLKDLSLDYNYKIGADGCKNLSQGAWPLVSLDLSHDEIGPEGCRFLCQAKSWELNTLVLSDNKIGLEQCNVISQTKWPLSLLYLTSNNIPPAQRNQIRSFFSEKKVNISW